MPTAPADDPLEALAASYAAPAASSAASSAPRMDLPPPRVTPPELFDPMASFGSGMLGRDRKSGSKGILYIAIGGAAVAVVAAVVIITMTGKKDTPKAPTTTAATETATPAATTQPTTGPAPTTGAEDPNTGFDLYVNPPGTMTWRLDGEARTTKLPSRVRGIAPGVHTIQIDAPSGFLSQNQTVTVELGHAPKVEIVLQPLEIAGTFESDPAGATVSLIVDGKRETLGPSPVKYKLDPRKTYQVLFEKPGFVSRNQPIMFAGGAEENVAVTLEKAGSQQVAKVEPKTEPKTEPKAESKQRTQTQVPVTRPDKGEKTEPKTEPKSEPKTEPKAEPAAGGQGTLLLGSKPPCDIFIDGKSTGLQTPQRDIKLSAGKHKITLVNNEFGIKETFAVDIKADATEKQIKDYSDRIPK
ncbi:MAG: PEGA domain-containing protein [Kofleriaceae bacterium]|nr:PEGA domain-containing protein [Kofleriaceae bacterium]